VQNASWSSRDGVIAYIDRSVTADYTARPQFRTNPNNMNSFDTPARVYAPGIGDAVADRTINRVKPDGSRETWADVAYRVAQGNSMLGGDSWSREFESLHHHLRQASVLMSGRHLQHTDHNIGSRNQEVLTNCSTSASSFILFYLLLNGSGVGRSYDDDMMLVDYNKMPIVVPIIRHDHKDVLSGEIGQHFVHPDWDKITEGGKTRSYPTITFKVPDSREGWAKAVEQIERMTWDGTRRGWVLLLDFSDVRPRGAPIGGMQGRPASGPGPLMEAIRNIATLRDAGYEPFEAAMWADHYLAECVLVGGARRAARMATKTWRDKSVLKFVNIKKGGVLWSSNNSVTVDAEFWKAVREVIALGDKHCLTEAQLLDEGLIDDIDFHAWKVFQSICEASYHDGTGEPGLINVDRLEQKDAGVEVLFDGDYAESTRFKLDDETKQMTAALAKAFAGKKHNMIVNPCGEIPLSLLGGYCVIADVVPFHAAQNYRDGDEFDEERVNFLWDNDAEDAFRVATRALLRVNTMDCLYKKEVRRTNRIGVGFTGIHEYAWARFGYGWKDLVNEQKSLPFWQMMSRFSNAVVDEARSYSAILGLNEPHTTTTVKPAGTTSKLFGLTEGAHLPSMREYLRWVQFRNDDPLIEEYRAKGYPVRRLKTYSGTTIVGFPTVPTICTLGMGDMLVTAAEATPEEQYQWLRLLEKYWLHGYSWNPTYALDDWHEFGGQVSYTLKYDPKQVDFASFQKTLLEGQSTIKACSVMPQSDTSAYEYQPEEPVTAERFQEILSAIQSGVVKEEVGFEHVDCATGACPVDFLGSER
jgi:ribonucleoside-triphosphate reductase (formate)